MAAEDLFGTPEHRTFRDTVRKFAEEELAPRAREFDEAGLELGFIFENVEAGPGNRLIS